MGKFQRKNLSLELSMSDCDLRVQELSRIFKMLD